MGRDVGVDLVNSAVCWGPLTVPVLLSVVSHRKLAPLDRRRQLRMATTGLQWLGGLLSVTLGAVLMSAHTDSTNYLLGRESNE